MTPEEEGLEAKRIIESPAFQAAIARMKGECFSQIVDSNFLQKRKREHLYRKLQNIVELESELESALNNALIAARSKPKGDN